MNNDSVLELQGLCVDFQNEGGSRRVVDGAGFSLGRGRTLGIVGESGSGKSVTMLSVMGLLPPNGQVTSGTCRLAPADGTAPVDLLSLGEREMQQVRGRRIAMIFQEPMTSLNPLHRCGRQVVEALMAHTRCSASEAKQRALELFAEVKLPRPEKIFDSYPHEISGGQKQRVMIAMALICSPDVLIADEPTTALDVTVQHAILDLLRQLQACHGLSIIFISHDLGVVSQIADEVMVMYHGKVVESGDARQVMHHPQAAYTQGLLACRPPLDRRPRRLPTVQDFLGGQNIPSDEEPTATPQVPPDAQPVLMSVRNLEVSYPLKKNLWGQPVSLLKAVDGVSFDIYEGETLGLVGESGCGKSTLGRALLQLIEPTAGNVSYRGQPLGSMRPASLRKLRTKLQIIFQDPYSSLNPKLTVGEAIQEPLRVHGHANKAAVLELMERVGLAPDCYHRYPHQFSGGQRQRICIARALILKPELVICDESVSALDVSVQAQVLNLLNDLKSHYRFTYLFITHDLSVVHYMADRIMVMQKGKIVESGTSDDLFLHPQTEYTRTLLASIPRIV